MLRLSVSLLVLLLCTLVRSFTHAPRHLSRRAPSTACYSPPPPPTPDPKSFEDLCDEKSDLKHPCFVHWAGSLDYVNIVPFLEPVDVLSEIVVKNDALTEFTIRNASDAFMITYRDAGRVSFIYSNFDNGCYNVTLVQGDGENWRIWFADDTGNDRDVDTLNQRLTGKRVCDKWGHIHVKDDSHWYNQKR